MNTARWNEIRNELVGWILENLNALKGHTALQPMPERSVGIGLCAPDGTQWHHIGTIIEAGQNLKFINQLDVQIQVESNRQATYPAGTLAIGLVPNRQLDAVFFIP